VTQGIRKQAKRAGARLVFCDAKFNAAVALKCAKELKTKHVDGYLNYQSESKAAARICKAGPQVPVIAITIKQEPCQIAYMGANNHYAGMIAGKAIGAYFKQVFNCRYDAFVSLEDPADGETNSARMGGYRDGFSKECGKIHNLRKVTAFEADKARATFADVLTALQGDHHIIVVGINDDGIEGAVAAAKTANRLGDIYVSGQGADKSAWCAMLKNKNWIADTAYFPMKYGEIGIPYLIDAIHGKQIPKTLYVPHGIVNATNVKAVFKPSC
jgi:ribose transport system substrate-binding protein